MSFIPAYWVASAVTYPEGVMLGDITNNSLNACLAAMFLSELCFFKSTQAMYDDLRPQVEELLDLLPEVIPPALPPTIEEFQDAEDRIVAPVLEGLGRLRARVNGDVLPLTFFILTYSVFRGYPLAAFNKTEEWKGYRGLLELSLRELGLDVESEVAVFEASSRALVRPEKDGGEYLRNVDRISDAADYIKQVFAKAIDQWSNPTRLAKQVEQLTRLVDGLRRNEPAAGPAGRQADSDEEPMPGSLRREFEELEGWAKEIRGHTIRDEVSFWSLKCPTLLAAATAGLGAYAGLAAVGVFAASVAGACALVDAFHPFGALRKVHRKAYHDIRSLIATKRSDWRARDTKKSKANVVRLIIQQIQEERLRITRYVRDAETAPDSKPTT